MFKRLLNLQWKSFFRKASFKTELWIKIFMGIGAFFVAIYLLGFGVGAFFLIEKQGWGDPLRVVNKFLVYYLAFDFMFRYMLQKMPVANIKPLLYQPIKKSKIVHFILGQTASSFFNWTHAFFFIPFSIILLIKDYTAIGVIGWHLAAMALIYAANFLNVLVNSKDVVFYSIVAVFVLLGVSQYYSLFDVTSYTQPIFDVFYDVPWTAIVPWLLTIGLYFGAHNHFLNRMYLDAGLAKKTAEAKTEEMDWLNRYGALGTFLKNDIRLIKRNKRSRTAVLMSVLFLFYGLLFFTGGIEAYDNSFMKIFAGIFVTGGFLFTFGQFVPSWDSSYYPLMMSQNIKYREYLDSKWYLVLMATVISTILATPYLYFGWQAYAACLVGGIYNLGINSHLVLWGGAYIKMPVDLTSNKKAFGDKQAFNGKTLLLSLPKLLLPIIIYALGHFLISEIGGYVLVALVGLCGFIFKNKVFNKIEEIYKKEKYKTLQAYKQKS
ncbi:DUF5687 family protein [Flavobacterium sp. ASW18X]|uniref:DUF5687 family protein n=1 Tax=Flavobacterium sp. ASW18X TaxID=2572595 RepID=UPI0010ADE3C1|nr:DUF5687 family protein [Flavobacterium sp. ASW18X]TKD65073.1 hypothetical protein FBT53_05950 [Flavobacterium sp. ASW18X]